MLLASTYYRVAMQPGESEVVREFQHFIQNLGKIREIEKSLRGEAVFIQTLKPTSEYPVTYRHIKWSIFFLFVAKSQILVNIICD